MKITQHKDGQVSITVDRKLARLLNAYLWHTGFGEDKQFRRTGAYELSERLDDIGLSGEHLIESDQILVDWEKLDNC